MKKSITTQHKVMVLVIDIGGNTFLIKYWYWLLQYFCILVLVLVLVVAIQFINIVNNPEST